MMRGAAASVLLLAMGPSLATAPDAIQRDTFGSEWTESDGVITKTYYSPSVTMAPGEIIMQDDIRVPFVDEPAAIVNIASDLVDQNGDSVPLSQAYMHHWLLEGDSDRNSIPGFGAGSEYRGLPEGFKKPFGLMVGGDEEWDATLHLLDLRLTPPNMHLPSLECRRRISCSEGPCLQEQVASMPAEAIGDMYANYPGGLFCCDAGSDGTGAGQFDFSRRGFCPACNGVSLPTLQYRLKMVVSYVPLNIPVAQMDFSLTPQRGPSSWQNRFVNVYGSRLQVSAPGLEYSVPVCDEGDDMCIHVKSNTWRVNEHTLDCVDCPPAVLAADHAEYLSDPLPSGRVGIAWAAGHQHDGALGLQLWLKKPGQTDSEKTLVCHSAPVIGSEVGVAGNEAGFVTGQMACRRDEPIEVPVGSTLTIRSIYDAHRPK